MDQREASSGSCTCFQTPRGTMAEGPFFMADTPFHPDHLRMWEKAVYVDENRRTWLPITLKVQPLWGQACSAAWMAHPWPGVWTRTPQVVQALEDTLRCHRARAAGRLRRAGPLRAARTHR